MNFLTSLDLWPLMIGALVVSAAFSVVVVVLLHRFSDDGARERRGLTAAAYMTAVGSLFAILTGFLINEAYTTLQSAQDAVANEVAAGTQLAYASGALPPADTDRVQQQLSTYLNSLVVGEWQALGQNRPATSPAIGTLRTLQQTVFDVGTRHYVSGTVADQMASATAQMTAARQQWVAIAGETIPIPLFILAVMSGAALITNALIVSGRSGRRYGLVATGIIILVALDISAIIGISAPFQGPFIVTTTPVTQFTAELQAGQYLPWVRQP